MLVDLQIVIIPALLALAALFAAAEASLFTLSRSQLESIRGSRPSTYKKIKRLIYQPDSLLSTLIIGNECINILVGTCVVEILGRYNGRYNIVGPKTLGFSAVVLSTLLLLLVSEILPKIIAFRVPVAVASILVHPATLAHALLTPLRKVFLFLSERILRLVGVKPSPPPVVSEEDFLTLVEVGAESGSLEAEEKERIINVFNFTDLPVASILTSWERVFTIPEDMAPQKLFDVIRNRTFSRIPVVKKDGSVTGILYTKELIQARLAPDREIPPLADMIEPPYIVSIHKKVSKLFRELKAKKVHFSLVVDEYGKQLGIVTLEDVLNALFRTSRRFEAKK